MDLPRWTILKQFYPAQEAGTVFEGIGGKVKLNYDIGVFSNACATRISKALNSAGGVHEISYFTDLSPNGKQEAQVSSGKYKKWYIFRVKMLMKYLQLTYTKPEEIKPSTYKNQLKNRKGIIIFEVKGWSDATGHADLWDGSKCLWEGYGGAAHKILFWEAPK